MGCPGVHAAARVYYSEVSSFHAVGIRPVDRRLEILWQMPRIRIRRARTFQGCQFPRLSYWGSEHFMPGDYTSAVDAAASPQNRARGEEYETPVLRSTQIQIRTQAALA